MKWLLFNLIYSTAFGQWTMTTWDAYSGHYQQSTNFVLKNKSTLFYTVFMTLENTNDLSNQVLTCAISVHGALFDFRGKGVWNNGPLPASARLYFTDTTNVYSNISSSQQPNSYWWSTNWLPLNVSDCLSFSVIVTPERFTNGVGQQNEVGFYQCARNVKQVGIAFGGGSFYDTGVAVSVGQEALINPSE